MVTRTPCSRLREKASVAPEAVSLSGPGERMLAWRGPHDPTEGHLALDPAFLGAARMNR